MARRTGMLRRAEQAHASPESAVLAADLRRACRGSVRFGAGSRALYATDASNYRQTPIGVVIPRTAEDVLAAIEVCRAHDVPVLARGGATSLAGQCCNAAVILDCSRYLTEIVDLDPEARRARVQPGVILDTLRDAAEQHHLTFGPDPATHNHCTLGGMIGNDSCGVHSLMAGKTVENVESLDVLTYDGLRMQVGPTSEAELARIIAAGGRRGEIYAGLKAIRDRCADLIRARYPKIPRRVSGYNLDQLLPENGFHVARALVGSENTCVTVLEATVRLVPSPPKRALVVLGFADLPSGCDRVPEILAHRPIGLEGFDGRMVADMKAKEMAIRDLALLPDGEGWLLVEFGGESGEAATRQAQGLIDAMKKGRHAPAAHLYADHDEQQRIWRVRESALGATARVPGASRDFWPGWEDSAVPPDKMGAYLRDLRGLLDSFSYDAAYYGHMGQGCLHMRVNFDLTSRPGIETFRSFIADAADLVLRYGGSLSGEHGDGQARAELLPKMYGADLVEAFGQFKRLWDPRGKLNPGKMVDPYRIDENLRLGVAYNPPAPKTHFSYPDDRGSFAVATLRCVGIGKCRRPEGGTMCPSYMVTRAEQHSTRGRARLLFEMLRGDPLTGGWRSEPVKEALDLCLACKGCKGECPVSVDMATYKAEFLSHYYAGRLRPSSAYAFGLIMWWARLGALAPGLVNTMTQSPVSRAAAKRLAGIAPERRIPAFASETFLTWFARRGPRNEGKPRVCLWPDTFNNHFHPTTARAATEVLERLGYQVIVPDRPLCCGRPLYDYGMLGLARRFLCRTLATLHPLLAAGMPIVVLEPSCAAVFRDELTNLFPHDQDARRLREQTMLLSEFLVRSEAHGALPRFPGRALLHGHCHQKALMGMESETAVLRALGMDFAMPDTGCCGMAGAFGFERRHYDLSIKVGERVLLPAVRAAPPTTLIVADGFSCREQIAQTTDRTALHLAEVVRIALRADVLARERATPKSAHEDQGEAAT